MIWWLGSCHKLKPCLLKSIWSSIKMTTSVFWDTSEVNIFHLSFSLFWQFILYQSRWRSHLKVSGTGIRQRGRRLSARRSSVKRVWASSDVSRLTYFCYKHHLLQTGLQTAISPQVAFLVVRHAGLYVCRPLVYNPANTNHFLTCLKKSYENVYSIKMSGQQNIFKQ